MSVAYRNGDAESIQPQFNFFCWLYLGFRSRLNFWRSSWSTKHVRIINFCWSNNLFFCNNPKANEKTPWGFCVGNQDDANFCIGLQKIYHPSQILRCTLLRLCVFFVSNNNPVGLKMKKFEDTNFQPIKKNSYQVEVRVEPVIRITVSWLNGPFPV